MGVRFDLSGRVEANRVAAERVWKAVGDKQKGGTRLKIPIKILAVTPERIEGAISDRNQASKTVDIVVSMARPLTPLLPVGAPIWVVGTLSEYQTKPFSFHMSKAELADSRCRSRAASAPIHGRRCARANIARPGRAPRRRAPELGNACTACSDPDVVSQGPGPCP